MKDLFDFLRIPKLNQLSNVPGIGCIYYARLFLVNDLSNFVGIEEKSNIRSVDDLTI